MRENAEVAPRTGLDETPGNSGAFNFESICGGQPERRPEHGASRQKILREVFEQFWQYSQCMPVRNRHTLNAAWRLVVETWLRRQGWISVTEKPTTPVSTNSEPFCSQNWFCTTGMVDIEHR
jgi:hypothetical protein